MGLSGRVTFVIGTCLVSKLLGSMIKDITGNSEFFFGHAASLSLFVRDGSLVVGGKK
jgi:hypothetical protein